MTEYKPTEKDYRHIWDLSHREWTFSKEKDEQLVLCKAYVKSFCSWLTSKGLSVIKGKIIKDE